MQFQAEKKYAGVADGFEIHLYPLKTQSSQFGMGVSRRVWYVRSIVDGESVMAKNVHGPGSISKYIEGLGQDFSIVQWSESDSELYEEPPWRANAGGYPDSECVYFIEAVGSGRVKIGWTKSLLLRLDALTPGCPYPLKVLATIAGSRKEEIKYHHRFVKYHLINEWFRYEGELKAFVKSIET